MLPLHHLPSPRQNKICRKWNHPRGHSRNELMAWLIFITGTPLKKWTSVLSSAALSDTSCSWRGDYTTHIAQTTSALASKFIQVYDYGIYHLYLIRITIHIFNSTHFLFPFCHDLFNIVLKQIREEKISLPLNANWTNFSQHY